MRGTGIWRRSEGGRRFGTLRRLKEVGRERWDVRWQDRKIPVHAYTT